jgi:serine protease
LRHAGDKGGASSLGPEVTLSAPEGNCVNTIGECLYPILSTTNSGKTGPQCSTYTNGLSDVARGTSFSAPMVAGTAALMLAAQPSLTPDQLAALLKSTARSFPSRAAGDTTPMCQPTTAGTLKEQINCHCTSTTCGAGMLDSGAAVRAAAAAAGGTVIARLTESQARVPLNSTVQLSATGSTPTMGRTLSGYQWRITDGSALAQLTGATNAATATLAGVGEGWVTVELAVTDSAGVVGRSSAVLRSGSAPAAVCGPDDTDVVADAGGGGALAWPWLAGLALAVGLLGLGRGRGRGRAD